MVHVLGSEVVGPLEPYVEGFGEDLARQGYTVNTSVEQLRLIAHVSRWTGFPASARKRTRRPRPPQRSVRLGHACRCSCRQRYGPSMGPACRALVRLPAYIAGRSESE